jgi:hypothetical protein
MSYLRRVKHRIKKLRLLKYNYNIYIIDIIFNTCVDIIFIKNNIRLLYVKYY